MDARRQSATSQRAKPGLATALVVDDDPLSRALARAALQRAGVGSIATAGTAAEAAVALTQSRFDLLVCDLAMPDVDGLELLRTARRAGFVGAVVILSGHDLPLLAAAVRVARNLGLKVLGAVQKPIDPLALRETLARAAPAARDAAPSQPELASEAVRDAFRDGHLAPLYQPIVDVESGALWGVEVLARLRDTTGALITPDRFIGVAERHGLAEPLLDALLGGVERDLPALRAVGSALHLALNLAPRNLDAPDLPQRMAARLGALGLEPARVTFEITESELVADVPQRLEVLARLRLKGYGLSIDDFGTGYSTIAQLRSVPFTTLKIDRGFVAEVDRDPVARKIVEYSIGLARELGLAVVAEGVERPEELEVMRVAGAARAQGYLFAKPLSAAALVAWSTASRPSAATNASRSANA